MAIFVFVPRFFPHFSPRGTPENHACRPQELLQQGAFRTHRKSHDRTPSRSAHHPSPGPGDRSVNRTLRSFLSPDLLILDDLGLHRLTGQQSANLYELTSIRHWFSSFVITSNRSVEEWLSLFDDPILGNSALDRLANASTRSSSRGPATGRNYRPTGKSRATREVIDPTTVT